MRRCFSPEVADNVKHFRLHPNQRLTTDDQGCVTVTFRAGGLAKIVWRLFTWGRHVEVLEHKVLRMRYRACIAGLKPSIWDIGRPQRLA